MTFKKDTIQLNIPNQGRSVGLIEFPWWRIQPASAVLEIGILTILRKAEPAIILSFSSRGTESRGTKDGDKKDPAQDEQRPKRGSA